MSEERATAVKVEAARLRWRAQLHRLNDDEAGASYKENLANLEERHEAARQAWIARKAELKADCADRGVPFYTVDLKAEPLFRAYKRTGLEMHEEREISRELGPVPVRLDNFSEPSDDELLGGVA